MELSWRSDEGKNHDGLSTCLASTAHGICISIHSKEIDCSHWRSLGIVHPREIMCVQGPQLKAWIRQTRHEGICSWGANAGPRHASTLETQAHVARCFLPQESPAGWRALRVTGAQQGSVSPGAGHSGTIRTGFLLKAGGLALRWEPRPAGCCRRNPEARESCHRQAASAPVPGASSCPQSSEFSAK